VEGDEEECSIGTGTFRTEVVVVLVLVLVFIVVVLVVVVARLKEHVVLLLPTSAINNSQNPKKEH
jgi:hypothetical protein